LAGVALLLLRLGLAALFIAFSIPKIREPDLFALSIFNYHMLPHWGVNAMAIVLPWLELFLGVALAIGLWRRASALVVSGLMVVFIAAFVTAKARGLNISCGCFELGEQAKPSSLVWVVLRDLSFLGAALLLVRYDHGPSLLRLLRRKPAS
jgi:uncharacterized membrane protein YphA (DoxX/SURF4 family)